MQAQAWQRRLPGPFLGPSQAPLSEAVTTPDVLVWRGQLFLYVGAVHDGHERLVAVSLPADALREAQALSAPEASIVVDIARHGFGSEHVFDPAAVVVDEQICLYYSAVGGGEDQIGLAISADGIAFEKHPQPVLAGRAPEVFRLGGRLYLFYVRSLPRGGYAIFLAVSDDRKHFAPVAALPVFRAAHPPAWDSYEVTTPRLFERHGVVSMPHPGIRCGRTNPWGWGWRGPGILSIGSVIRIIRSFRKAIPAPGTMALSGSEPCSSGKSNCIYCMKAARQMPWRPPQH
jgi:hypothetical protein